MTTTASTTRVQVSINQDERSLSEKIVQKKYGLSLSQVLRLVVKKIIHGEFAINLFVDGAEDVAATAEGQANRVSSAVEKEIVKAVKSGVVTLADETPLTHYSIEETMAYLESEDKETKD